MLGMWTRLIPRASDQAHIRGRRSGYGYGYALQKRRGLCSEARMTTGVDARSASLFIRDPARVVSLFISFLNFTLLISFNSGANIAAIGYHIEITNPPVQWQHFPHDPRLGRDARARFLDSSTPLVSM